MKCCERDHDGDGNCDVHPARRPGMSRLSAYGGQIRVTRTYAILPVSRAVYDEIAGKLRAAGYSHAFNGDVIDMHGIAIDVEE